MEQIFDAYWKKEGRKNETRNITFFANGSTTNSCTVPIHPGEDELWKIKKRLLKKLRFKNYRSEQL